MESVMTSIQRLAQHLSRFSPVLIEKNIKPDIWLTEMAYYQPGQREFAENCLYIRKIEDVFELEILKYDANLLLVTSFGSAVEHFTNQRANVIVLTDDISMFELSNELQGFVLATRQFRAFAPQLIAELSTNNRLRNYLQMIASQMEHPVALYDSAFQLIASENLPNVIDPVWFYIQRAGIPLEFTTAWSEKMESASEGEMAPAQGKNSVTDAILHYLHQDLPDLLPTLVYPILYEHGPLPRRLLMALRVDQTNAYLVEVPEADRPFTSRDAAFLHLAAGFLQYYMSTQYRSLQQDSIGRLIEDVINESNADAFLMFERARNLQFLMEQENYLLVIYTDRPIGFQQLIGIMHDLREETHGTAVLIGSEILLFVRKKDKYKENKEKIMKFFRSRKDFRCAASTMFSNIAGLRDAYIQCRAARELGGRMQVGGFWFEYDAYRELHFTMHALTEKDIEFFCIPEAKEIVQYDRAHKTQFAYTLLLYLKNFKNGSTVASIMNTHRNTMFYRLEKIASQFGLDYDNPTQMNNLSMSFNILAPQYPEIFQQ